MGLTYDEVISGLSDPMANTSFLEAVWHEEMMGRTSIAMGPARVAIPENFKKAKDEIDFPTLEEQFTKELFRMVIRNFGEKIKKGNLKFNPTFVSSELLTEENKKKIIEIAEAPDDLIDLLRYVIVRKNPSHEPSKADDRDKEFYRIMKERFGINEELSYCLSRTYLSMASNREGMGESGKDNIFVSGQKGTSIRIYTNTPFSKDGVKFELLYIQKCMERGLDYTGKYFYNIKSNDRTIFYVRPEDLAQRVEILEEIKREHPEIVDKFGDPVPGAAKYHDSYYGICHKGIVLENGSNKVTYNSYLNDIFHASYVMTKARVINRALFGDRQNLSKEDIQFIHDIVTFQKFGVLKGYEMLKESMSLVRYWPDGEYGKRNDSVPIEGSLSWQEINKRLNGIVIKNPKLKNQLNNMSASEVITEFRECIRMIDNFAQGRNLSERRNIAVNKRMEDYLSKYRGGKAGDNR